MQWNAIVQECQRETEHMQVRLDTASAAKLERAEKLTAEEREALEDEAVYQATIPGVQSKGPMVLQGRELKRHASYSFACVWVSPSVPTFFMSMSSALPPPKSSPEYPA